ncbi:MAG: CinA family nicotinamide mononucleotide deamidase-related protein [Chloroflexi bacterium]|nr:CinA family nicotinamide mononucleotide deamidase-related protein [Chloroflexota bacterium]
MTPNINAEIIAIGTEILLGEITDTNSVHIARVLRDIGLNLYYMTSVGDNEKRIADCIRIALSRAQVVITCGGLGPTVDDMTRQGVALAAGRSLVFHQQLLDKIAERFAGFRVQMTENNRRQAYLPDGAILIENPVGTAPAFIVEHEGRVIISLPGVPREMKYLLAESVVPFLRAHFQLGSDVIKARVLRTAGIGESTLDSLIGEDLLQQSNPTVGLAAHTGQVDIRITAKAGSVEEADRMIAATERHIRERCDKYIFGTDDDRIESVLVRLLLEHHATLAISETGIGGNTVSRAIEAVEPGSQIIQMAETYPGLTDLRDALGANAAIPMRTLAEQAAEMLQRQSNAAAAIAIVSDPDMREGADSEGGTAIAVYMPGNVRSRVYGFGGQSELAAAWVSSWSLSMLWRMLKEQWDVA